MKIDDQKENDDVSEQEKIEFVRDFLREEYGREPANQEIIVWMEPAPFY